MPVIFGQPPRDTRIYTDDKGELRDLHTCAR